MLQPSGRAKSLFMWILLSASMARPDTCLAGGSSFTGLGQLPAGANGSSAAALSADGQVVVGLSDNGGGYWQGFLWTRDAGMSPLPPDFRPSDVSADGMIVVGTGLANAQAARWTEATGLEWLGTLNGDSTSSATGISADGSTIVGTSARVELVCCDLFGRPYYDITEVRAFVLDVGANMRALHPPSPSILFTSARAASADGTVIAGWSGFEYGPFQACIWRDRHAIDLGAGEAYAVSADGSVVVGYRGNDVFRWTEAGGMEGLCWPGPLSTLRPLAVSADGSVIVGCNDFGALIWDAVNGARPLQDVLINEFGLDLTGWTLNSAVDISDDGRTIVGTGTNPSGRSEAWIAQLGDPLPSCSGDLNSDSVIDLSDLATVLAHFGTTGATYAQGDIDRDGDVDLSDLAVLLASFGATCPSQPEPNITGLGFLPNGYASLCYGVSADGSAVVGTCYVTVGMAYDYRAFRWSEGAGMIDLGTLPGGTRADAWAASSDGSMIVGQSQSSTGWYACRWTSPGQVQSLGTLPGGYGSRANDVSGDGSVIVGSADNGSNSRAFRWTSSEGMVSLGLLPGGTESYATDVSADGSTIVGGASIPAANQRVFRWTRAGGMADLGALPGFETSMAFDVNADGSVVVGESPSYGGFAFRWSSDDGMVNLGALPGDTSSAAMSVSADGATVMGVSRNSTGGRWFLWTASTGMVDVSTLVHAPPDWWPAIGSTAISADARTVVGTGTHCGRTEAWTATLQR